MRFILLLIVTVIFSSCTDFDRSERIEQIDCLISALDSIAEVQQEVQIVNLNEVSDEYDELGERIFLLTDTIPLDLALKIDGYKKSKSGLLPYTELNQLIDTNVLQSRSALNALRSDVVGAHGERKDYDENISFERSKVDSIRGYLESLILVKSQIIDGYDLYYDDLNTEIDRLTKIEGTEFDE